MVNSPVKPYWYDLCPIFSFLCGYVSDIGWNINCVNWLMVTGLGFMGGSSSKPLHLSPCASRALIPLHSSKNVAEHTTVVKQKTFNFLLLAWNIWPSLSLGSVDDAHSVSCQMDPESFGENSLPFDSFFRFDGCSVLLSQSSSFIWPVWMFWLVISVSCKEHLGLSVFTEWCFWL